MSKAIINCHFSIVGKGKNCEMLPSASNGKLTIDNGLAAYAPLILLHAVITQAIRNLCIARG